MKPSKSEGAFEQFDSASFEEFAQLLHEQQIVTAKVRQALIGYDGAGYIWRGQRDAARGLQASALRDADQYTVYNDEEQDLKSFVRACDALGLVCPDDESVSTMPGVDFDMVAVNQGRLSARDRVTALAQHHDVPTTFLDWSHSPLTALGHAVWGSIKHLADRPAGKEPKQGHVPRIALWRLDASMLNVDHVRLVPNRDPANDRQRHQRGTYTQVLANNEFPTCDLLEVVKAKAHFTLLRCFTFPGEHVFLAYHWLVAQNITPGTAYGGYEGAGRHALTERHLRIVRRRYEWLWEAVQAEAVKSGFLVGAT